jgi:ribonuclease HI
MANRPGIKVFFDGGCRPNPGAMELAVVVRGQVHIQRDLGHGTSMDAEWLALIQALRTAQTLSLTDFVLLGDSLPVIRVATGQTLPRPADHPHLQTFRTLAGETAPRLRHIPRAQNLAGVALNRLHPR